MRALVQRVSRASVRAAQPPGQAPVGEIGAGLLVLLGVGREDGPQQAERLAAKVRSLRVFPDAAGNMNEALGDREILCVSQFTLYGDTSRGNRPSFVEAAPGPDAEPLYELFCRAAGAKRGLFGAHMIVELANDGPVTLLLEV
jgi:D-aminoacyl-tRNA deacylase